jgi:mono/diheme cytochrome c family protein
MVGQREKMRTRILWIIAVLAVVLVGVAALRFNLTALHEPGTVETRVANSFKHFFVYRASQHGIPPRSQDTNASIERGAVYYGQDCGICHGGDGRAQQPPGRWMYPRASDLTNKRVQNYSDQELFWIIHNGIRFTGMPAFGEVETPDHVWDLVNYVRILSDDSQRSDSAK